MMGSFVQNFPNDTWLVTFGIPDLAGFENLLSREAKGCSCGLNLVPF
jgi:hypothetical protein